MTRPGSSLRRSICSELWSSYGSKMSLGTISKESQANESLNVMRTKTESWSDADVPVVRLVLDLSWKLQRRLLLLQLDVIVDVRGREAPIHLLPASWKFRIQKQDNQVLSCEKLSAKCLSGILPKATKKRKPSKKCLPL